MLAATVTGPTARIAARTCRDNRTLVTTPTVVITGQHENRQ
jgi:hypothetical protein